MSDNDARVFYSSKLRLVHVAANIALAPVLLYLFGLWSLPPSLPHYITFAITGLIAHRYARARWNRPMLVIDEAGLHFDEQIPAESIQGVERFMRSLKVRLLVDGVTTEKVVGLGWASNDDFKIILDEVNRRFGAGT